MSTETISFDILIVGGGPAGLSAAIKLAQLNRVQNRNLSIGLLEKGAEVGAHSLSGAVFDPKPLSELFPENQNPYPFLNTPVTSDTFLYLTQYKSMRLPLPGMMRNHGCSIVSLGVLCRWLAQQAEALGVQVFTGFAATQILYNEAGAVCGVKTGDQGLDKTGKPTAQYQPGIDIFATQTLFAEGCRGSLTKVLLEKFQLYKPHQFQTYALGIKEIWEVPAAQHKVGAVLHSVGWPLDHHTYGGSFLYHLKDQKIAVGFVVGLDYSNPYLNPYEELQRFKTHPAISAIFKNGRRLAYGARTLSEGGWQSIPKLYFPGGALIGDSAGFLNVPRIKGIHTSMKSGMIAAECLMAQAELSDELTTLNTQILNSWIGEELYKARNIRPAFKWGLWSGLILSGLDMMLFKGKWPVTLSHRRPDHQCLKSAKTSVKIDYPVHDQQLTFDKSSSVYLSNTYHRENQPVHLILKKPDLAIKVNYLEYGGPEARYCPAGVYEWLKREGEVYLQINAANCVHCKACDIKDCEQNIDWVPPEGGGGPHYEQM